MFDDQLLQEVLSAVSSLDKKIADIHTGMVTLDKKMAVLDEMITALDETDIFTRPDPIP